MSLTSARRSFLEVEVADLRRAGYPLLKAVLRDGVAVAEIADSRERIRSNCPADAEVLAEDRNALDVVSFNLSAPFAPQDALDVPPLELLEVELHGLDAGLAGSGRPGSGRPGSGRPGSGHPGSGHPGSDPPGSGHPGSDPPGSDLLVGGGAGLEGLAIGRRQARRLW